MVKKITKNHAKRRAKKKIKGSRGFVGLLIFASVIIITILGYNWIEGYYDGFEIAIVERIVDGDTILLANGERVRLIGIDAPEIGEPGAIEATEFVESLIPPGTTIWLERSGNNRDRFGRLRRYVWLDRARNPEDEREREANTLNELLVSNGHAVRVNIGN